MSLKSVLQWKYQDCKLTRFRCFKRYFFPLCCFFIRIMGILLWRICLDTRILKMCHRFSSTSFISPLRKNTPINIWKTKMCRNIFRFSYYRHRFLYLYKKLLLVCNTCCFQDINGCSRSNLSFLFNNKSNYNYLV